MLSWGYASLSFNLNFFVQYSSSFLEYRFNFVQLKDYGPLLAVFIFAFLSRVRVNIDVSGPTIDFSKR